MRGLCQGGTSAAERGDQVSSLAELLLPAVQRVGWLLLAGSYLWAIGTIAAHHPEPCWAGLAAPAALALAGVLVVLRLPGYLPSVGVLWVGLACASLLELQPGHASTAQWLALGSALTAGFLGGNRAAAASLVGWLAVCVCLGERVYPLALQAVAGTGLSFAVAAGLHQALLRLDASECRAWRLAREARERRGEIQRQSKALQDMYALLERTSRELELARREAEEAREVKARFAANISHELRTPLNLILGFSRMMYRSPEVYGDVRWTPTLRADVREIYRASKHLMEMIDDILDLARIEARRMPLKLEPCDLRQVIEDAVATARGLVRDGGISLELHLPASLPRVLADATRIRQVILNLLNNAIRFTEHGRIEVVARVLPQEVEVAVRDTGVGIAPEDLASIFDVFAQGNGARGGAGLGLAICRQFVQLHGGRIWAESELGKGSTFYFTLPLSRVQPRGGRLAYYAPEGWAPPLPQDRLGKCAVVLARDERAARTVARGLEGFRAIPLCSLEELPTVVESEHPAGVILVKDPTADEPCFLAEEIWRATGRPDLGVLECSLPFESLVRKHLQVDAYLTKPVLPEKLAALALELAGPRGRILVVDDEPGFSALAERAIASACPEAQLRTTGDPEVALALLRDGCDLLLLDLAMPEVSGIELLARARQAGLLKHTKVAIVTGAPYVEELASRFPTAISFRKLAPPRDNELMRCAAALLEAAPPDYSIPPMVCPQIKPVPVAGAGGD